MTRLSARRKPGWRVSAYPGGVHDQTQSKHPWPTTREQGRGIGDKASRHRHVAGSGPSTLMTVAPTPPTRTSAPASSVGRDRLAVDQARGHVDEVALADLDHLAAPGPNSTVTLRW